MEIDCGQNIRFRVKEIEMKSLSKLQTFWCYCRDWLASLLQYSVNPRNGDVLSAAAYNSICCTLTMCMVAVSWAESRLHPKNPSCPPSFGNLCNYSGDEQDRIVGLRQSRRPNPQNKTRDELSAPKSNVLTSDFYCLWLLESTWIMLH